MNVYFTVFNPIIWILTLFFQAFLIAFTSDFIQKLVYKYEYGESGKMDDYVMFTLSRSPQKNWIDRGQVGSLNMKAHLFAASF